MNGQGIFFLVAGPTAAGKSTVVRRWVEGAQGLVKDVSVTTRAPRAGEVDGRDYHFWGRERFEAALARGEFLEHAVVHGEANYGTLREAVAARLREGLDVTKDIDVQGVEQVRRAWPYPRSVAVFMAPPTPEELLARFRSRGAQDTAALSRRLQTARREMERAGDYDYLVWNDRVEQAVADLEAIRRAEHCRGVRGNEDVLRGWRGRLELLRP